VDWLTWEDNNYNKLEGSIMICLLLTFQNIRPIIIGPTDRPLGPISIATCMYRSYVYIHIYVGLYKPDILNLFIKLIFFNSDFVTTFYFRHYCNCNKIFIRRHCVTLRRSRPTRASSPKCL